MTVESAYAAALHGPILRRLPHVLTVAGSDSGAGAGIQADIKACAAAGVYCSSVITAVTAQNTVGVQGVYHIAEDFVAEQLRSVLSDIQVDVEPVRIVIGLNLQCTSTGFARSCALEHASLWAHPVMTVTRGVDPPVVRRPPHGRRSPDSPSFSFLDPFFIYKI